MEEQYSNAMGYGIFCGKSCARDKEAQGIPPKRGKRNIARFEALQAEKRAAENMANRGGSQEGSSNGLIIAGVLATGVIITLVVVLVKKSRNK